MKHSLVVLALAALLSGCGTLEGKLENRLACTVSNDKLFVISEWGPIGISSVIADQDRQAVCVRRQ